MLGAAVMKTSRQLLGCHPVQALLEFEAAMNTEEGVSVTYSGLEDKAHIAE